MAAVGLLALLDDITWILDDVAAMSKVAAKKTAGLAGDDLAVNAENLVGLRPKRELPIVGKVALGSLVNKIVLVPLALAVPSSWLAPLLMFGGVFLCYEGVHKVLHRKSHDEQHHSKHREAVKKSAQAVKEVERKKVRQAILTDLVLSAEIVAIALSAVIEEPMVVRATVVSLIALGMTAGIYGAVAVIVKLDDFALYLIDLDGLREQVGKALLAAMPWFMRALSIGGTVAMFLVGGGILLHGLHAVEEVVHQAVVAITHAPFLEWLLTTLATILLGVAVGFVATGVVEGGKAIVGFFREEPAASH